MKKYIILTAAFLLTAASLVDAGDWKPNYYYPPGPHQITVNGDRELKSGTSTNPMHVTGELSGGTIESIGSITSAVSTTETVPNSFNAPSKVQINTTAEAITFPGATSSILIKADSGQTDFLYIGGSGVSNAGINSGVPIEPGQFVSWRYDASGDTVYIISGSTNHYYYKFSVPK